MPFVALGLGSNQVFTTTVQNLKINNGTFVKFHPIEILQNACSELGNILEDSTLSSVYISKAMYETNQNDFFNMVVCGFTKLSAESLLSVIHEIEAKWGRNRSKEIRNGPRTLDIDIELYGTKNINTDTLIIPHPRISERQFVLQPLVEILLQKKHCYLKSKYKNADIPNSQDYVAYLNALTDQGVKKYSDPFILRG